MRLTNEQELRFWSKVKRDGSGCWIWTGAKLRGYGLFSIKHKTYRANRIAWMLANGRMPRANMDVCHICDNPSCVNPRHLWEGTRSQNLKDAWSKNRLGTPNPHDTLTRRFKEGIVRLVEGVSDD